MKNDENKIRKNAFMKYNNIEEEFFEIDKEKAGKNQSFF